MANNIKDLTQLSASKLISDRTRRADLNPIELSDAHIALGSHLAGALTENLELEEYELPHCQGVRSGIRIKDEQSIGIIAMLRAGIFLSQGVRTLLRNSPLVLAEPERGSGFSSKVLDQLSNLGIRHAVLVDAVVNTGSSITPLFPQLRTIGVQRITVIAGVAPYENAHVLALNNPEIDFIYARLSRNSYVGKGSTDTGNRLFGTQRLD